MMKTMHEWIGGCTITTVAAHDPVPGPRCGVALGGTAYAASGSNSGNVTGLQSSGQQSSKHSSSKVLVRELMGRKANKMLVGRGAPVVVTDPRRLLQFGESQPPPTLTSFTQSSTTRSAYSFSSSSSSSSSSTSSSSSSSSSSTSSSACGHSMSSSNSPILGSLSLSHTPVTALHCMGVSVAGPSVQPVSVSSLLRSFPPSPTSVLSGVFSFPSPSARPMLSPDATSPLVSKTPLSSLPHHSSVPTLSSADTSMDMSAHETQLAGLSIK